MFGSILPTVKRELTTGIRSPSVLWYRLRKAYGIARDNGISALGRRIFSHDARAHNYRDWVHRYDTLTAGDLELIRNRAQAFSYSPLISIILPTYNTPEVWLRAAIESVRAQIYDRWELCIADDSSSAPWIGEVLREYCSLDSRIKVIFRPSNGHISEASNSAAALAEGEFLSFLDHDDELRPHSLFMVVDELNRNPQADLIYSDEDKIDERGQRSNPYFKPSWNPELLLTQNYICHLSTIRRALFEALGGFRVGFEGAQDWDLFLRVTEAISADHIRHIPHVLYHWRSITSSTALSSAAKPYVLNAQKKAVEEHLVRTGQSSVRVEFVDERSHLRVRRASPQPEPFVSLIIPTKDNVSLLSKCVEGVLSKTAYANLELLIVDNGSVEQETAQYLGSLQNDSRVKIIRDDGEFNFARINNAAVRRARGTILGFLNNDIEVISADWLSELVSQVVRDGVGAVGARLLFPSGLLQHAGVVLGIDGVAGHPFCGRSPHEVGYFHRASLAQNVSAVTAACMLVKRSIFEGVGGFDEDLLQVAFNDVDLCLKIRGAGQLIVYTPHAELIHHESATRGYEDTREKLARFASESRTMKSRWGSVLNEDPYYNPNLTLETLDFALSFPPRVVKPWRL